MQKKKKYVVGASFWKDGVQLPVGKEIWLFPSEAKYRGNALVDPDQVIAVPAAPAAEPAAPVEAPAADTESEHDGDAEH
ncbi:hypothetical protein [Bradyrhizobium sp. th.b2]|uniref:hypothetical protein n=1 Tax=Bradyrhizobium sp. th-b2 TaxID=172088 RepID=UPI0003FD5447|nr:hypothetical protein [Bradyrhizobium sp. th.b2]